MTDRLSHADVQELLGAFALDAVDGPEHEAVELHLLECPRCRAEVAEHREVAAFLAHTGDRAPEGVWDRIAAAVDGSPPDLDLGNVVPLAPRRRRPWARRVTGAAGAAAAAAAVASVAVLGLQVVDLRDRLGRTEAAMVEEGVLRAALAAEGRPDARTVRLVSDDGTRSARAVVLPDGRGYLIPDGMRALPAGRTYQLWAIVGDTPISAAVLGGSPKVAAFHLPTPGRATLALTAEDAPGAVRPTSAPLLAGELR